MLETLLQYQDQLLAGTQLTIELAFASLAAGLALGLMGAAAQLSNIGFIRLIGLSYTQLFRGIPELLTVLALYFGLSHLVLLISEAVGYEGYIEISPFMAGTLALGLTFGAFAAEVIRGAIIAIPQGQWESAYALGFSKSQTFCFIIFPQMLRLALPGLGNLFLVLLKDTALVSVIGLDELMRKSAQAVNFTREPFTFYLTAAAIYLALTAITMLVLRHLEQRTNRGFISN